MWWCLLYCLFLWSNSSETLGLHGGTQTWLLLLCISFACTITAGSGTRSLHHFSKEFNLYIIKAE